MNELAIILEAEQLLPQLDAAFQRGTYILHPCTPHLSDSFHRLCQLHSSDNCIACYSSVMDLQAAKSLPYRSRPSGRCFAMYFGKHPEALGREIAWTAIVHEAAHYLTDSHPSRDEPDEEKAIKNWWGNWDKTIAEHSQDWLRAACHLGYRAMQAGLPVAFRELLASAGVDEKFVTDLRGELVSRVKDPIEQIVGRGAGGHRRSNSTPKSPRNRSRVNFIKGSIVSSIDGQTTINGKPVSEAEYRKWLHGERPGRVPALSVSQQLSPTY